MKICRQNDVSKFLGLSLASLTEGILKMFNGTFWRFGRVLKRHLSDICGLMINTRPPENLLLAALPERER